MRLFKLARLLVQMAALAMFIYQMILAFKKFTTFSSVAVEESNDIHETNLPTMFIARKADMAKTEAKFLEIGYAGYNGFLPGVITRYPDYMSGDNSLYDSVEEFQVAETMSKQDKDNKKIDTIGQYDNTGGSSDSDDLAEEYPLAEGVVDYSTQESSAGGICPIQISWQGNGDQGFDKVLQTAYAHLVDDNNTWTIRKKSFPSAFYK